MKRENEAYFLALVGKHGFKVQVRPGNYLVATINSTSRLDGLVAYVMFRQRVMQTTKSSTESSFRYMA